MPAGQEPTTIILDTCTCPFPVPIDRCVCACLRRWSCFYTANHRTTCNVDTPQVISTPSFFCHLFLPTTFAPSPLSHRRVAATCSPFAPAPHNMPSTIHVRLSTTLHVAYLSWGFSVRDPFCCFRQIFFRLSFIYSHARSIVSPH